VAKVFKRHSTRTTKLFSTRQIKCYYNFNLTSIAEVSHFLGATITKLHSFLSLSKVLAHCALKSKIKSNNAVMYWPAFYWTFQLLKSTIFTFKRSWWMREICWMDKLKCIMKNWKYNKIGPDCYAKLLMSLRISLFVSFYNLLLLEALYTFWIFDIYEFSYNKLNYYD